MKFENHMFKLVSFFQRTSSHLNSRAMFFSRNKHVSVCILNLDIMHTGSMATTNLFWNCSDSVVFFVLFFYYILNMFRQFGIFFFFNFLLDFGHVPTVWYYLFYFSIRFWTCSDSLVFAVFHVSHQEPYDSMIQIVCFIM